MKVILNHTRSSRDRFTLIDESMGCHGDPKHYPTYRYSIANGIDRGNGYQGYYSITAAMNETWIPKEVKDAIYFQLGRIYPKYFEEIGYKHPLKDSPNP